ncbi:hypothetical protein GCM10009579_45720 [Streptomyces javensis]|uniref:Uncharacterized protein n=1 Tax=Streptomyces javensis TaxID=114698 RepID=A0ABN1X5L1_9ACTN
MDPETKWEYKITWACGASVQFHYTEDELARARYIQTSARTVQSLKYPIQQAKVSLPVLELPQLLEDVSQADTSRNKGAALIRLGVSAPRPYHEEVFLLIGAGLRSSDETIRGMSIIAAFYSLYSELRPLLRSLAQSDPLTDLRTRAESILAAFDNLGVASE